MTQQTLTQAPAVPEAPGTPAPDAPAEPRDGEHAAEEALVADELLVEEVSIDGMCGVY